MGLFDKAFNKLLDSNEEFRANYEKTRDEAYNRLAQEELNKVAAQQRADPSTLCVVVTEPTLCSGTVEYPDGTHYNMDVRYAFWVQDGTGNAYRAQFRFMDFTTFLTMNRINPVNYYRPSFGDSPSFRDLNLFQGKEVAGFTVTFSQWPGLLVPMQLFDNGTAEFSSLRGGLKNDAVKAAYKKELIKVNEELEAREPNFVKDIIALERGKTRPFGSTVCKILEASYRMGAYDIQVEDWSGRKFRCAFEADDDLRSKMLQTIGVNNGDYCRGDIDNYIELDKVADESCWAGMSIPLFLYADGSADPCFTLDDAPNPNKLHQVKGTDALQYLTQPIGKPREAAQTVLKTVPELTRKDILGNDGFTDEERAAGIQRRERVVGSSLVMVTGYNNRPYGDAVKDVVRLELDDCNVNRYQTDIQIDDDHMQEVDVFYSLWANDRDFYADIAFDDLSPLYEYEKWMDGLLPAFLYTDGTADLTCIAKEPRPGAQLVPSCGYDADWAEIRMHYSTDESEGDKGDAQTPLTREELLARWRDLWREDGSSLTLITGTRVWDDDDGKQMLDLTLDDCDGNHYLMSVPVDLSEKSPFHDIPCAVVGNNPELATGHDDPHDAVDTVQSPGTWMLQVIPAFLYADGTARITPVFNIDPEKELVPPSGYDTDWSAVRAEYEISSKADAAPAGDADGVDPASEELPAAPDGERARRVDAPRRPGAE